MKFLLLAFFIICTHTIRFSSGYLSGNAKGLDSIGLLDAIRNKCATAEDPKQMDHALKELRQCTSQISENYLVSFDLLDNNQDHCNYSKASQFRMCFKNLLINISPCLDKNELYLQEFLLNAFDGYYEELCGANETSNKQYLLDKAITYAFLFISNGACNIVNLNIFKDLDKGVLNLNKHDVCSDLESFHKCTTDLLESLGNEEYFRYMNLMFNPLLGGCNNVETGK